MIAMHFMVSYNNYKVSCKHIIRYIEYKTILKILFVSHEQPHGRQVGHLGECGGEVLHGAGVHVAGLGGAEVTSV